ncbi:MAG: hypothetical protein Kow00129_06100 [Thermoleophilia bacterium]
MSLGRTLLAVLLIILGLLFLAGNLGLLDWAFLTALWRLWPLILVILGVHFLFGRGRRQLAAVLILVIVLAGLAFAVVGWQTGWAEPYEVKSGTLDAPSPRGIEEASLVVDAGALDLDLEGGAEDRIVEGRYRLRGEVEIEDDRSGSAYSLSLRQSSPATFFPFPGETRQFLELTLAENTVWDLEFDLGAAGADLDLRDIVIRRLALDAGASSVTLTLGREVAAGAEVVVDGGAGSFDISLPDNLTVTLATDTGLSSRDVDERFTERNGTWFYDGGGEALDVRISAGVSSIDVNLY